MPQSTFTSMTTRPLPRWILATRGSLPGPGSTEGGGLGGAPHVPPPYRLCLLGQPAVLGPSGPITDEGGRQRRPLATLALLARAGSRGCSREHLAGLLWPEVDEHKARHSLSEAFHTLRRGLGDSVIVHAGDAVCLGRGVVTVDADQFEEALRFQELERAVMLYTGPFLDGFSLPGSQAFDEWMEGERRHLSDCYAGILDRLAAAATAAGDLPAAAGWWRQRLDHEPLCSHAAEALMDVLAAAGDRAAAIRIMEEHVRRLRNELGVEPSPALQEAVRRLRTAGTSRHPATRPLNGASRRAVVPDAGAPPPAVESVPGADRAAMAAGVPESPLARNRRTRRALAGAAIGLVAVVAGAVTLRALVVKPAAMNPDLIAVPIFGLVGPTIEPFWAEGFAGLVAIKLEAAGALDALVMTQEVPRGGGRLARSAGRRAGAGLVIVGTLAAEGPDSLALEAELYDAARDRVIGRYRLLAQRDRLDGLASRFVRQVLARIDSTRAPASQ